MLMKEQCYWARQDGDDRLTWRDANLTKLGIEQAEAASAAWRKQIKLGMPAPQTYYTSPLRRCLDTAELMFGKLALPSSRPFIPTVKEVRISQLLKLLVSHS